MVIIVGGLVNGERVKKADKRGGGESPKCGSGLGVVISDEQFSKNFQGGEPKGTAFIDI